MRYKVLGDVSRVRSVVFYASKTYFNNLPDFSSKTLPEKQEIYQKPIRRSTGLYSSQSDLESFLEYNFDYKANKGILQEFNLFNILNDYTIDLLTDKENISNLEALSSINSMFVMQLAGEKKSPLEYFILLTLTKTSELLLDMEENIRRVEFFSEVLEDDYYAELKEYVGAESQEVPEFYVDFGPEVIYRDPTQDNYGTQFYFPEEVPDVKELPSEWTDSQLKDYMVELDELLNRKLLIGTITSDDDISTINLSLSVHEITADPHRNQKDYVAQSIYVKSDRPLEQLERNKYLVDQRSLTYLATEEIDPSKLVIYNDKVDRINEGMEYVGGTTEKLPVYKKFLVYNYGDKVVYNGLPYQSVIDGNIGQVPSISPFWDFLGTDVDPSVVTKDHYFITSQCNSLRYGYLDPLGVIKVPITETHTTVTTIKIVPYSNYRIEDVIVNGRSVGITNEVVLSQITSDQSVYVEFVSKEIFITIGADPEGSAEFSGSPAGQYQYGDKLTITSTPKPGYEFISWIDSRTNRTLGTSPTLSMTATTTMDIVARLKIKVLDVRFVVEGEEEGKVIGINNGSVMRVDYGSTITINCEPKSGYNVFRISVDDEYKSHDKTYTTDPITENCVIKVEFRRPCHWTTILGKDYNWVTIGDYDWITMNLLDESSGTAGSSDDYGTYFNQSQITSLKSKLSSSDNDGFVIPTTTEWGNLLNTVRTDSSFTKDSSLKSSRQDSISWKTAGDDNFLIDILPSGSIDSGTFTGVGTKALLVGLDGSQVKSYGFTEDSDDVIIESVPSTRSLPIRLCRPTSTEVILGGTYKVVEINGKLWMNENLRYKTSEIGVYPQDKESIGEVYYGIPDITSINSLLEGTGWRVSTDDDWLDISQNYLGNPANMQGKRLKNYNSMTANYDWEGYETNSPERSFLTTKPTSRLIYSSTFNYWEYYNLGLAFYCWSPEEDAPGRYRFVNKRSGILERPEYFGQDTTKMSIRLVKDL